MWAACGLIPVNRTRNDVATTDGFTIVEIMIFLAISSLMLLAAQQVLTGKQGKSEFGQVVHNFETVLQDTSDSVINGNSGYDFPTNKICVISDVGALEQVTIKSGPPNPPTPGINERLCTFVGKVLALGINNDKSSYRIFPVVGNEVNTSGNDASSLAEARPVALSPGSGGTSSNPDYSYGGRLADGVTIEKLTYNDGSDHLVGAFGFLADFTSSATNSIQSTGSGVDVVPITGPDLTTNQTIDTDKINDLSNYLSRNPKGGIDVCLKSAGSDQIAHISIGGGSSFNLGTGRLTVSDSITQGGVC